MGDVVLRSLVSIFSSSSQEPSAHKPRVHGGGREAHGAAALHGLGEPQAVPAPVQARRGQQPAGEHSLLAPPPHPPHWKPDETLTAVHWLNGLRVKCSLIHVFNIGQRLNTLAMNA